MSQHPHSQPRLLLVKQRAEVLEQRPLESKNVGDGNSAQVDALVLGAESGLLVPHPAHRIGLLRHQRLQHVRVLLLQTVQLHSRNEQRQETSTFETRHAQAT